MTIGAIEDSRQLGGTLTLNGTAFAKQATSVECEPTVVEDGDEVETLSGARIGADERTEWALNLGVIQDFDDSTGIVNFCRLNAGDEVDFVWEPNQDGAPTINGVCKIRAMTVGGAIRTRLTSEVTFPCVGEPAWTYPTP